MKARGERLQLKLDQKAAKAAAEEAKKQTAMQAAVGGHLAHAQAQLASWKLAYQRREETADENWPPTGQHKLTKPMLTALIYDRTKTHVLPGATVPALLQQWQELCRAAAV